MRANLSALTPDIFDILRDLTISIGGEIQFADSINLQVKNNMVRIILLIRKRFVCGNIRGY